MASDQDVNIRLMIPEDWPAVRAIYQEGIATGDVALIDRGRTRAVSIGPQISRITQMREKYMDTMAISCSGIRASDSICAICDICG